MASRIGNSCALVLQHTIRHCTASYIPSLSGAVIRSVIYEFAVRWIQIYRDRIDFVCASLAFKVLENFSHNKFSPQQITKQYFFFHFFFCFKQIWQTKHPNINNSTMANISFRGKFYPYFIRTLVESCRIFNVNNNML